MTKASRAVAQRGSSRDSNPSGGSAREQARYLTLKLDTALVLSARALRGR